MYFGSTESSRGLAFPGLEIEEQTIGVDVHESEKTGSLPALPIASMSRPPSPGNQEFESLVTHSLLTLNFVSPFQTKIQFSKPDIKIQRPRDDFTNPMDQYRVVREIGKGGYGRALLVKSVATGELKVVKEMNLAGLSPDGVKSALKEVEILSSLKHTNIIRYRNCSQTKKKLFILMDYADGGDLAKHISQQRDRPMPEDTILDFFVQIDVWH